jgi:hypothetical protein
MKAGLDWKGNGRTTTMEEIEVDSTPSQMTHSALYESRVLEKVNAEDGWKSNGKTTTLEAIAVDNTPSLPRVTSFRDDLQLPFSEDFRFSEKDNLELRAPGGIGHNKTHPSMHEPRSLEGMKADQDWRPVGKTSTMEGIDVDATGATFGQHSFRDLDSDTAGGWLGPDRVLNSLEELPDLNLGLGPSDTHSGNCDFRTGDRGKTPLSETQWNGSTKSAKGRIIVVKVPPKKPKATKRQGWTVAMLDAERKNGMGVRVGLSTTGSKGKKAVKKATTAGDPAEKKPKKKRARKPVVLDPAGPWKAAQDPKSGKTYYFHKETKETRWKPPKTAA